MAIRDFFRPLLVSLFLLAPARSSAQSAPDYVFKGLPYADKDNVNPIATYINTSWSWSDTTGTTYTMVKNLGGTPSGNSASVSTSISLNSTPAAPSAYGADVKQKLVMYVRNPGSYNVQIANNAHVNVAAAPADGGIARFSGIPWNTGLEAWISLSTNVPDQTDTSSPSTVMSIACNATPAQFAQYPGIDYYELWSFHNIASVSGSKSMSALTEGTIGVTLTPVSGSDPVPVMDGPYVNAAIKDPVEQGDLVTIKNLSYDPDNAGQGTGICTRTLQIVGPDGANAGSGNGSQKTFSAAIAGPYKVTIGATDDEGATSSQQFTIEVVRPPAPGGSCGAESPSGCPWCACGESPKQMRASANKDSGNIHGTIPDPVRTRGYPLTVNVHFNSQSRLLNRTTDMGESTFTYGVRVQIESVDGVPHYFLIDADGTELDYGVTSASPVRPAGAYAELAVTGGGYELTNASRPERIERAGNYQYTFDADGKLLTLTDPSGNVQEVHYNGSDDISEVEDLSSQKSVIFEYDTPGEIARIVMGGGESVAHLSYTSGKLSNYELKDSSGTTIRKFSITYDGNGRPYQFTRDNDSASTVSATYSEVGSGMSVGKLSWNGGQTDLNYFVTPPAGAKYRVSKKNAQNQLIFYDYDTNYNLKKVTFPTKHGASAGAVYTFGHDSNGNVTSISDGATTLTISYNSNGLVSQVSDNASGVWTYSYNGVDLTSVTDSLTTVLSAGYTDAFNPHSPTTITDGEGNVWTYEYNQYGQLTSVTPPTGSPEGETTYDYEENNASPEYGYLRTVTNGAGDVATIDDYTPLGDVAAVTTSPSSGMNNTITYEYDAAQRLREVTHPDGKTLEFSYSGRDLASIVDESGEIRSFDWCIACGKLTGVQAPLGKNLSWSLNSDHEVGTFLDARSRDTVYTYGNAGELKWYKIGGQTQRTYRYDNLGRLKQIETNRARKMDYSYGAAGNVSGITFTNPTQTGITYAYNTDGTLQQTTDEAGTTSYTYKDNKLVESVSYSFTGLTPVQLVEYEYNPDKSLSLMTWKSAGSTVASWEYDYDSAGRLETVSNSFGESVTFAYDGEGKVTAETRSNGTETSYIYNQARGWPTFISEDLSGTPFASYSLVYDGGADTVGNITQVTELDGSVVTYGYDDLSRLTSEARTGTGPYSNTYGYDLAGNITSKNAVNPFATYSNRNGIGHSNLGIDADGNLISISSAGFWGLPSGSFTWDTRQKMTRQTQGSAFIDYKYDAFGKRVVRTPNSGGATFYIFSEDELIGEISASGGVAAYTWGDGKLLSQRRIATSSSLFYHYGPQGETRQLTRSSGAVADTYRYDAYGQLLSSTGTDPNPYLYGGSVGYYSDGPHKLMLATHRWYSPHVLRWLSMDPIEYRGGDNMYTYVYGNPIRWTDAVGLGTDDWWNVSPDWNIPACGAEIAGAAGDFWDAAGRLDAEVKRAKREGRKVRKNIDKYYHCLANCYASRRGNAGRGASMGLSDFNEGVDSLAGALPWDCAEDHVANDWGRTTPVNISCEKSCARRFLKKGE